MGSARLVNVVEDRLYAVLADPGAVLDVAGALEVGEGRLHPVFEAGDLLFELGQLGGIEDHVILVVFCQISHSLRQSASASDDRGSLSISLPAFLMLAKLEHDVGQLGDEELFYREPDRVARPWQTRYELGAYGSGDRATHDRCGPDLLVGEHPEDLTETVELLFDHAVDNLIGRVAARDPCPTRRYNSVNFCIRKQVYEARPDAIHLVPDDLAGHDLLPRFAQDLFCGVASRVGLAGPRVADGEHGDPDMLRGRLPVPVDTLAQNSPPCRNGLVVRSFPISVGGPCPGKTLVSSGSVSNLSSMLRIRTSMLPPGRSTLPTLPAKRASPDRTRPSFST